MTKWTREPPKEGWYWVRYFDDNRISTGAAPTLVENHKGRLWAIDPHGEPGVLLHMTGDYGWEEKDAEWQPVRPPED